MKSTLQIILIALIFSVSGLRAQILYSNNFNTSLGSAIATNSSSANWIWTNSCAQSTATGHSAPGSALFNGSSCQYGNGSNTVSGDLITPAIAIGPTGGNLSFNYFLSTECQSPGFTCTYDILSLMISNNGGSTWTTIMASNGAPSGITETGTWLGVVYNLSSYINQTISIKFNFNSLDGIANNYDGVYVDDILVTGNCPMNLFATPGTNTVPSICSGASVTLATNAANTFSWSTGSTTSSLVVAPTITTIYSVTAVTTQSCASFATIAVVVSNGAPTLTVTNSANPICLGASTSFSASGALTYTWSGGITNGQPFSPSATTSYTLLGANGCGTTTVVQTITVAPLAVSALASQTLVCQGGPSVLSATSSANSFSWIPGSLNGQSVQVTPVANTIYTVTASNGTCAGTQTVLVTTKTTPTITSTTSSLSVCAGVNVTLTASGAGTGGTYSWSPGGATTSQIVISPTTSAGYIVFGTNTLNCTSSTQQPVIVQSTPTVGISANKTLVCTGGAVILTANGATSYSWTSGPNTAVYTLTQTAASSIYTVYGGVSTTSCIGTQTITISAVIPNVTVASSLAICSGASATLMASGANTYTWNGTPVGTSGIFVVSPLVNTNYVVQANTNSLSVNCLNVYTTQVIVNALPTLTVVNTKSVTCKSQTNTLTATGAVTYTWSTGSAANVATVNPSSSSFYTVTGTDAKGCVNYTVVQAKVSPCAGIDEQVDLSSLVSVYPNPNAGSFKLNADTEVSLQLFDELGKHLMTLNLNASNSYSENVTQLSPGIYFLALQQDGIRYTQKIVVTR